MKLRLPIAAAAAVAMFAVPASSALAASTPELVQGTTAGSIAITAGTGALMTTGFSPGNTATQTGALTATSTSPSWTLQASDQGTGAGKMVAAATGCTGSDSQLTNATKVTISSALGGVTSAGQVTLSGTDQTVASATSQLLAANVLTTNYSVLIPSGQKMLTGCVYSQNITYTLS